MAAYHEFTVVQGDYFTQTCRWRSPNSGGGPGPGITLTLITVAGGVMAADGVTVLPFTCVKANQTTSPGEFTISLTSAQTLQLPPSATPFDLQFTEAGNPKTIMSGRFNVTKQVFA